MPAKNVIQTWIELGDTYLTPNEKDPKYGREATLLINRCEVRQLAKGTALTRRTDAVQLTAADKDELEEKVSDFAQRPDVRRLAKGVQSNDFRTLPHEQRNPPQDVLDGTARVYMTPDEAAR